MKSHEPKQELKHIYLDKNNLYRYVMSKFLPTSGFKDYDSNKYSSKSPKGCVLYIKEKKLSTYQLEFSHLDNIPIGNHKKLELYFF